MKAQPTLAGKVSADEYWGRITYFLERVVPVAEGRRLACEIPGAEYVELDSRNHVLLAHEPAWKEFQRAVLEFTGADASPFDATADEPLTTRRVERSVRTSRSVA